VIATSAKVIARPTSAEPYSSPKLKRPSSKAIVTGMNPIAESTVATITLL
jgi:hypothetical protein